MTNKGLFVSRVVLMSILVCLGLLLERCPTSAQEPEPKEQTPTVKETESREERHIKRGAGRPRGLPPPRNSIFIFSLAFPF